jgi:hypothetical protein
MSTVVSDIVKKPYHIPNIKNLGDGHAWNLIELDGGVIKVEDVTGRISVTVDAQSKSLKSFLSVVLHTK